MSSHRRRTVTRRTWITGVLGSAPLVASDARPVMQVDVPFPTKDKPQSKLWFAQGTWWAWLPVKDGSSVWRRTPLGWQRQTHLDDALRAHPGQADVWADAHLVRAVLVGERGLASVALRWDERSGRYAIDAEPTRLDAPSAPVETATIARDSRGRFWIAYTAQRRVWVHSMTGGSWGRPVSVSPEEADNDDICAVTELPDGVGVLWSDQRHDAVYFRRHPGGGDAGSWDGVEVVAQGGRTADDHINTALGADGTLYVVMKNSVDQVGRPQLVLRVRSPQGRWSSHEYATKTERGEPSRPIVLAGGTPERLTLIHTVYGRRPDGSRHDVITAQSTTTPRLRLDTAARTIVEIDGQVNDATGPKSRLPASAEWIVLCSDKDGRVYEAGVG